MSRDPTTTPAEAGQLWAGQAAAGISPEMFKEIVATAADVALVVDRDGLILSVVANPLNPTLGQLDQWTQRDIRDVLARDSLPKLERQLDAIRADGDHPMPAIEVNHRDVSDLELPVRYTLHRVGQDGAILMLGRDLRPIAELQNRLVKAQLALERDYESQRDYETRYRRVLEASRDAFVLIDVTGGKILDLNSAAARVLGGDADDLRGGAFTQEFENRRRSEFVDALIDAAHADLKSPLTVTTRRGGQVMALTPMVFRAGGDRMVLVRIEPEGGAEAVADEMATALAGLFRHGADGIVVTDGDGGVVLANDAFLSLADATSLSEIKGRSMAEFLTRGSVDLRVMLDNAARSGRMRIYATRLQSTVGAQISVEISATSLPGGDDRGGGFAFVLRDVSRMEVIREPATQSVVMPGGAVSDEAMRNVMDLVGSAPLKDIVAATTDVVEKMCIETAVELTDNNRVAAAEMLGLSRQSLYVKLRKYGLLRRGDS